MSILARESTLSVFDVFTEALRGVPCDVVRSDGLAWTLPVDAWVRTADDTDRAMVGACVGTTIDVGCGPGRMSAQLVQDGHIALGIDVVREAVAQTRSRGVTALRRDVFDRLPGEGRWQSALLADGNIGIGGDPVALLARIRELLSPTGIVVVELAAPGTGLQVGPVALRAGGRLSDSFPWAVLGTDAVAQVAARAGFVVKSSHEQDRRWWSVLGREN